MSGKLIGTVDGSPTVVIGLALSHEQFVPQVGETYDVDGFRYRVIERHIAGPYDTKPYVLGELEPGQDRLGKQHVKSIFEMHITVRKAGET